MTACRCQAQAGFARPWCTGAPVRLKLSCCRRSLSKIATSAILQRLGLGPSKGQLQEKILYKSSEMVQFGPLKVSPMGLGTWSWGNQFLWGYEEGMDTELQEVFNLVVSSGINLFDTADSYGTGRLNGRSEQLLGQFLAEYPGSARVQQNVSIASKFAAYPWRLTSGQFVGACRASLKRLRQDQLAIGQLHWSTANYAPLQERALWDGLVAMYDEGLVQAVGVSNYGPKQMQRIYKYLAQRDVPLASAQVQFSLLSKGSDQMDILQICQDLGIGVIAYSPLGLGMLTGRYGINTGNGVAYPPGPRGLLFRQILPGARPLLELMQEMASRRGKTVAQVAVNWCICQGTVPIPGAKSLAQAKGTLGALGWRLSGGEVAALSEAADALPRSMVQNIFQTK